MSSKVFTRIPQRNRKPINQRYSKSVVSVHPVTFVVDWSSPAVPLAKKSKPEPISEVTDEEESDSSLPFPTPVCPSKSSSGSVRHPIIHEELTDDDEVEQQQEISRSQNGNGGKRSKLQVQGRPAESASEADESAGEGSESASETGESASGAVESVSKAVKSANGLRESAEKNRLENNETSESARETNDSEVDSGPSSKSLPASLYHKKSHRRTDDNGKSGTSTHESPYVFRKRQRSSSTADMVNRKSGSGGKVSANQDNNFAHAASRGCGVSGDDDDDDDDDAESSGDQVNVSDKDLPGETDGSGPDKLDVHGAGELFVGAVDALDVPEADEPDVPEVDEPDVPKADESDVPEADEPDVLEADEPDVPEAEESDVPESDEPDVPEADEPDVPEAEESDVPEADEPDVPEAEESDVPEAEESDVPESDELDVPEADKSVMHEDRPHIPEANESDMHKADGPDIPEELDESDSESDGAPKKGSRTTRRSTVSQDIQKSSRNNSQLQWAVEVNFGENVCVQSRKKSHTPRRESLKGQNTLDEYLHKKTVDNENKTSARKRKTPAKSRPSTTVSHGSDEEAHSKPDQENPSTRTKRIRLTKQVQKTPQSHRKSAPKDLRRLLVKGLNSPQSQSVAKSSLVSERHQEGRQSIVELDTSLSLTVNNSTPQPKKATQTKQKKAKQTAKSASVKKREKRKAPAEVNSSADDTTHNENMEDADNINNEMSLYMWIGNGNRRTGARCLDLDVVLSMVEETANDLRDTLTVRAKRTAIGRFFRSFRQEMTDVIDCVSEIQHQDKRLMKMNKDVAMLREDLKDAENESKTNKRDLIKLQSKLKNRHCASDIKARLSEARKQLQKLRQSVPANSKT